MHHVKLLAVVIAPAFLVGCADPVGPNPFPRDSSSIGDLRVPRPPVTWPDSVRIPVMPVPPIYEEVPQLLEPPE